MFFEYSFDDSLINLFIIIGLWFYALLGTYLFFKIQFTIYHNQYHKDPTFEEIPTSFRWKIPLFAIVAIVLLGIPFLGSTLSVGFTLSYIVKPLFDLANLHVLKYGLFIASFGIYLLYVRKHLSSFLYRFIEKEITFEIFFRKNVRSWGILTNNEPIPPHDNEFKGLAFFGCSLLHLGLVPITLLSILELIF